MIEIAVGSQNPTKLAAVEQAFQQCMAEDYRVTGYAVESGVPEQPMNDNAMRVGAIHRADAAAALVPAARYAVGMEGGIRTVGADWYDMGWVCVVDTERDYVGYGATAGLRIPHAVRSVMETQGWDLSKAVAAVYKTDTVTNRDCSIVLTGGLLPADLLYRIGVLAAFADMRSES